MTSELDPINGFQRLFQTLQGQGSRSGWKPSRFRPPSTHHVAEIVLPGNEPRVLTAELKDVDGTGLRLVVSPMAPLGEGQSCTVRVQLDGERSYECHGVVRWVHRTANHHLVGITPAA